MNRSRCEEALAEMRAIGYTVSAKTRNTLRRCDPDTVGGTLAWLKRVKDYVLNLERKIEEGMPVGEMNKQDVQILRSTPRLVAALEARNGTAPVLNVAAAAARGRARGRTRRAIPENAYGAPRGARRAAPRAAAAAGPRLRKVPTRASARNVLPLSPFETGGSGGVPQTELWRLPLAVPGSLGPEWRLPSDGVPGHQLSFLRNNNARRASSGRRPNARTSAERQLSFDLSGLSGMDLATDDVRRMGPAELEAWERAAERLQRGNLGARGSGPRGSAYDVALRAAANASRGRASGKRRRSGSDSNSNATSRKKQAPRKASRKKNKLD